MNLKTLCKKMTKRLKVIAGLVGISVVLTACGNSNKPMVASSNQDNSTQQSKNVDLALVAGKPVESMNSLSVPVVLKNLGKNGTVINTDKFYLKIDGEKIQPLDVAKEPSNYHEDFMSNELWSGTLTFYLGTALTTKQLKSLEIYYEQENGQVIKGKFLNSNFSHASISNTKAEKEQQLGDYYSNITDYISQARHSLEDRGIPTSLKERFSDSNYDQVHAWIIISSKNPDTAILKVVNHSNTPLALSYDDLEVVDKNSNEIRIDPYYRSFYIEILPNKVSTTVLKLDSSTVKTANYVAKVRGTTNNRTYQSTDRAFHPIEVLQSDQSDLSKAYTLEPDQYPSSHIKYKDPNLDLKHNIFTFKVAINDYFSLALNKNKISIVGVNKDGSSDDKETPYKITPKNISSTNPTKIELIFDDLSVLKAYPHLELRYDNKKLMRIK
ncbi:hypothetical protein FP435_00115 (plasmid) [Lactobacillus sp. PV037]|uniref:hypothetical protein n=1 Tax=Lactobacillus sp. PV037 TaxID=2594496 RepID=UPI0022409F8A|nr:hypothetical protein [Lactobacillus sp. PV037]QNQ82942.1 hypothetical protein FP435_00115 [Lactobacillus sp. PV037]